MVAARNPYSYEELELLTCASDFEYFVRNYVMIFDATSLDWIPFDLWPAQAELAQLILDNQQTIALKPRQIGITWLVLSIILWCMLFMPIFEALIFSKREDEAFYLLGEERLRGMYRRLPDWMKSRSVIVGSASHFRLSNGSGVHAFPSNAGDSYTANFAFIDEADLVPDLGRLLRSVRPTVEAGGKLVMVSRVDKGKPQSPFKQIYRAAKSKLNEWAVMFLAWYVHPGRDQAWYDKQCRDALSNTGALDDVHEQYPATDAEALAPKTLDKRIAPNWLLKCYQEMNPIEVKGAPAIPGLLIYKPPEALRKYVIGIDTAEGNPTSDDSSITVIDRITGEEVAHLSGKYQPEVTAFQADAIGKYYNNAAIMVERNNHGHAVLLWLKDNSKLTRLRGHDKKEGWHSTSLGKSLLYDATAEAFREEETTVHTFATYTQLSSIEGSTLRAPEGEMDDRADSYALALVGSKQAREEWEAFIT